VVRASLVVFAVAFLAGIVAVASGYALTVMAAALGIAALPGSVPRATRAGALFALVAGMTEAAIAGHVATPLADTHVLRLAADVTAVQEEPGGLISTTLRFADSTSGTATLSGVPLPIGARVVIRGSRVPFDEARNPGEPSQRDIMAERGITWRVVHARVLSSSPPDPNDPTLWIPRARAWASSQVHARFPEPEATILAGAMWGERGTLAPDLKDEFQETGTVHVLVTAGLHLGVIAAFTVVLLEALGCGRILSSLVAIACVWAYAALSGDHLPSVRAATMLSFALVARAAGREPFSWNALALAAIVVAALRPASVTSVSFALSFSCVAAIFAFAKPIASALEEFGVPHVVREALAVAFATQLGTWPLTASAFLVIAPYAPLANALVVPIVGIALLGGFATLALGAIPPLANVAATIETSLVDWIVAVVRFVASLPGAHVVATPPPNWTIAVYDGALALAAFWISNGRSKRATLFIFAGAVLCLWPPRTPAHGVTITAIDVGQADAILIRTPRGHAYLVDAGGRLESGSQQGGASQAEAIGERIVVPFLIRQGIHHLDAVLLSHPHGDHAGGIAPVFRTLGANGFADSGQAYPGHAYHDALDVAREKRIPLLEPRGGDVWRTDDGVTFRFYGPTLPYVTGSRSDINSNSLVFRLEYGSFRMLFTGDAGAETEARLLAAGDDLRADVLKVGHHGSAYGTTPDFVRAVGARIAVVSVGRNNLFGHPSPRTLATLQSVGARAFRTDRDGAVTITTDGSRFETTPFLVSDSPRADAATP
jgi:competence protein ComEC